MSHDLDLPTMDASQALEFVDARGFKDWLKLVPMINVRQAHEEILDALEKLNRCPVLPIERLKMLELLRDAVALLQEENAKRYIGKPFPLAEAEDGVWRANVRLWAAMSIGYRHCWQSALKGDVTVAEHSALCGQRAIRYTALSIREHHLAYRAVAAERWQELYRLYRAALDADLKSKIVKDSLNRQTEISSCDAAMIQALLLAAANPSAMPIRQILWTDRLLDRWSNQSSLSETLPEKIEKGVMAIQLDQPGEVRRFSPPPEGERWRFIDLDHISRSIRKRVKYLRAGEPPLQLGLGEEYAAVNAEQNLMALYQEWCEMPQERASQRRPGREDVNEAALAVGINAAHYALNGDVFSQPDERQEVRGSAIADFQLFGGNAIHRDNPQRSKDSDVPYEVETWHLDNESAHGFKLSRHEPGLRVIHTQLLAVRPRPEQPMVLGAIRWLKEGQNGEIEVGMRMLPGVPQAVAVRATGLNNFSNRFAQSLLLPKLPALQTEASLVLPPGWFKPGRMIEVYLDGRIRRAKLEQLLERGYDFERIAFSGDLQPDNE